MATSGQSIQFFCSKCSTILKEAASPDRPLSMSEECPACGCLLSETLQTQPAKQARMQRALFQTAYEINACLGLGVSEIDSFLALRPGDRLCIMGGRADLLVARLCVRAFMPVRQSGLGAESIVFVDAGNSSDIYRCVNFARQFGLEIQKVLRGIAVSRAFTIHQLAALVAHELPKAARRFNGKLVVISDVLRMFTEDPQVSRKEACYLIGEIMESVRKIDNVLLVMSLRGGSPYDGQILPSFGKRIEASPTSVRLYDGRRSKQVAVPEEGLRMAR
jgi:Rad51 protein